MNRLSAFTHSLSALVLACTVIPVHAIDLLGKEAKPAESKAVPAAKPATIKDALGSAVEISQEVRMIEKRLESLDKSVAAINASIAPLGAVAQPERTSALLKEAGDLAYDRARSLIFLATACAAALILLFWAVWLAITRRRKT